MNLQEAIVELRVFNPEAADKLEQRTQKQWNECETEEYNRGLQVDETDLETYIGGMFDWELSPEGIDYWANVAASCR